VITTQNGNKQCIQSSVISYDYIIIIIIIINGELSIFNQQSIVSCHHHHHHINSLSSLLSSSAAEDGHTFKISRRRPHRTTAASILHYEHNIS